jgi:hypothetical protein
MAALHDHLQLLVFFSEAELCCLIAQPFRPPEGLKLADFAMRNKKLKSYSQPYIAATSNPHTLRASLPGCDLFCDVQQIDYISHVIMQECSKLLYARVAAFLSILPAEYSTS